MFDNSWDWLAITDVLSRDSQNEQGLCLIHSRSFKELRRALCQEPILQYPDLNKQFILSTDACDIAIGSVLSQDHDGHDLPIAYFSRVLNNAQKNYSATDKECLAIIESVEHFNTYLYGKKFKLVSDHEPL